MDIAILLILLVFIKFSHLLSSVECFTFLNSPNIIKYKSHSMCPDEENYPMHFNATIVNSGRNKVTINSTITISELIRSPFEAQVSAQRCDLNATHCEDYDKVVIPNMCRLLNGKNSFWADFIINTKPVMSCPLKKGTYVATNSVSDLSFAKRFPLAGYIWKAKFKFLKDQPNVSYKRMLPCIMFDVVAFDKNEKRGTS